MYALKNFVADLGQCHCIEAVNTQFSIRIKDIGYDGFNAFIMPSGVKVVDGQTNSQFVSDYSFDVFGDRIFNRGLPTDLFITQLTASILPFEYMAYLRNTRLTTSVALQLSMLNLWRVKCAWIVPLSTTGFIRGMMVCMRSNSVEDQKNFLDTCEEIHLMCIQFIAAFSRLSNTGVNEHNFYVDNATAADISSYEVRCLQWAARGKTYQEISQILNIDLATVGVHMGNVLVKLNTASRTVAVSIAVHEGIIAG